MYTGRVVLGRLKCIQPSHLCQNPDPRASESEVATEKQKRYKSPSADHILAELIQAGGKKLRSEIHKLIQLIRKKELLHKREELIV
jgi:hypothetical protein